MARSTVKAKGRGKCVGTELPNQRKSTPAERKKNVERAKARANLRGGGVHSASNVAAASACGVCTVSKRKAPVRIPRLGTICNRSYPANTSNLPNVMWESSQFFPAG